LYIYFIG
jgi:hypothetical protein